MVNLSSINFFNDRNVLQIKLNQELTKILGTKLQDENFKFNVESVFDLKKSLKDLLNKNTVLNGYKKLKKDLNSEIDQVIKIENFKQYFSAKDNDKVRMHDAEYKQYFSEDKPFTQEASTNNTTGDFGTFNTQTPKKCKSINNKEQSTNTSKSTFSKALLNCVVVSGLTVSAYYTYSLMSEGYDVDLYNALNFPSHGTIMSFIENNLSRLKATKICPRNQAVLKDRRFDGINLLPSNGFSGLQCAVVDCVQTVYNFCCKTPSSEISLVCNLDKGSCVIYNR
jgi:hypothetical protein